MKSLITEVGKRICDTIRSCATNISWQLETISNNQLDMNQKLDNIDKTLLSTGEAQRALLAKANENSQKIMEDVRKMRGYSDIMAKKHGLGF
jgi:hypothetical protein